MKPVKAWAVFDVKGRIHWPSIRRTEEHAWTFSNPNPETYEERDARIIRWKTLGYTCHQIEIHY